MLGTWSYEHPYCTDSDILWFIFLVTNVLIVSRCGSKRRLSARSVDVNVSLADSCGAAGPSGGRPAHPSAMVCPWRRAPGVRPSGGQTVAGQGSTRGYLLTWKEDERAHEGMTRDLEV